MSIATKIVAMPVRETETTAASMLRMVIENAHIDESAFPGKSILSATLDDWQIDLLSIHGSHSADLEDSNRRPNDHCDEDEAVIICWSR